MTHFQVLILQLSASGPPRFYHGILIYLRRRAAAARAAGVPVTQPRSVIRPARRAWSDLVHGPAPGRARACERDSAWC